MSHKSIINPSTPLPLFVVQIMVISVCEIHSSSLSARITISLSPISKFGWARCIQAVHTNAYKDCVQTCQKKASYTAEKAASVIGKRWTERGHYSQWRVWLCFPWKPFWIYLHLNLRRCLTPDSPPQCTPSGILALTGGSEDGVNFSSTAEKNEREVKFLRD